MKTRIASIYILIILLISFYGCRPNNTSNNSVVPDSFVPEEPKQVIITDLTGRDWDITHAVNEYGMKAHWFQFGIGIGAIPSVDNPRVIIQGSPEFPDSDKALEIFGVDLAGEQRAYARYELSRHEIFNDVYPESNVRDVAVGYCPLFNLAAVFDRNLDGRKLTFAPSGWTYGENTGNSLFVLIDKETLSLWFPMTIERKSGLYCIAGNYADEYLAEVQQLHRGTWTDWLVDNPQTKYVTE